LFAQRPQGFVAYLQNVEQTQRFVSETGFTFSLRRQRARLLRTLELLAADVPVTTIALELGYDNISAFIAMFRRAFGVKPGRYFIAAV
jgi:AraC-like DNA-binding protein